MADLLQLEIQRRINVCNSRFNGLELDLSNLFLTELPELPSTIIWLGCQNNKLTKLPEQLPARLKWLFCQNNKLTKLPDELPASLECIWARNNNIVKLPNDFPDTLKILYVDGNELETLPYNLPKLDVFWCHDNPKLKITKEIREKFGFAEEYNKIPMMLSLQKIFRT